MLNIEELNITCNLRLNLEDDQCFYFEKETKHVELTRKDVF